MTNNIPEDIQKKFSSLALYIQKTRNQLLPILEYIKKLKRDVLQYQLTVSTGLYQTKGKTILGEMKGWSQEIRTRTRGAYDTFNEEKKLLGDDFPESLRRILGDITYLFSRLLESNSELSINHLEQQIERLQKEQTSKEVIIGMEEALKNIYHVFDRLLNAVHTEEKDLAEEERMLEQISGNMFIEEKKDEIIKAIKELFKKRHLLQQHLDVRYEAFPEATIKGDIRKETIDNQLTSFLTVSITLEGRRERPSWDAHLRYDARGRFFEGVFGERKGFQYIPQEHHSYTYKEQMLREFPAQFIQFLFNSEIMKKKR